MDVTVVADSAHSLTLEIRNGQPYRSAAPHRVRDGARELHCGHENVFTLRGLRPATRYRLTVESDGRSRSVEAATRPLTALLDVRDFGARGDGVHEDTAALQAAIACCPDGGVVRLDAGDWLSGPLFLRSRIGLELARGARLLGLREIERWPLLPAFVTGADGRRRVLGTWEGVPARCHASLLNAIGVTDLVIGGEGTIDARAGFDTWWSRPKAPFGGWRPRTLLLAHAERVQVEGLAFVDAPSWTIHALRSRALTFAALRVEAPADSPNTDGIDPESCEDVLVTGAHISTGDDCVAIKSGTRDPDDPPPPSRRIVVSNCMMAAGHGAVVIGSEMAGGVEDVLARDCLIRGTDRGLRIKTRRGRGAYVRGVRAENLVMHDVGTPFVVNSFYWCDPDGRAPYVGDRRPQPVDAATPALGDIVLRGLHCSGVHQCAALVLGLPEAPVDGLTIENFRVRYAADARPGHPDMAEGIAAVARAGLHLVNVRGLRLDAIDIEGADGPAVIEENVR